MPQNPGDISFFEPTFDPEPLGVQVLFDLILDRDSVKVVVRSAVGTHILPLWALASPEMRAAVDESATEAGTVLARGLMRALGLTEAPDA